MKKRPTTGAGGSQDHEGTLSPEWQQTIEAFLEFYRAHRAVSDSTLQKYRASHSPETLGRQITFFFTDYLVGQRGASPHTVHGYRDTFKLLLGFAARRTGKEVADLALADLDASTVLAFLEHLESERKCSVATRNVRSDLLARRGIDPTSTAPVLRGQRIGRDGAAHLLRMHVAKAGGRVSTLGRKRVHPHALRHTTAVHMRRAGDDPNAIAALLGHAQITTTERF